MKPECSRVMDSLGGPLPAELEAHVASCAECRALVGGFDALGGLPTAPPPEAPAPKLEAAHLRARAELEAHPKATPWWRELLVLLAVYTAVFAGGLVLLGRHGLGLVGNQASPTMVTSVALLTLVLVGGGAFLAIAPIRRRLPWGLLALAAVGVALVQVMGGSGLQSLLPVRGMLGCMGTEVLMSVLPLGVALVLLCRSAFEPVRALAAGLSAAGVSLLVLHLHCSDGTVRHLVSAHVLPWLLLAGVAVLIRSRLPTRSYAP
ncbi:DUF1109 domain-containing protein [Pyxidicoccus parkwayensis]|uniref:DUF1109 domain-containing protein n=1 Tax=Pyxidicoccus parkwayensis TaxID=2813578 RepID=A0ABX7NW84_9BACT|nr:DUF1109 domain-containing protein [Pyxidicoccus parkwaysis]QSQ23142.1 DUF1109 domain-containing protein [Pyxidicoccus parkwaysis]